MRRAGSISWRRFGGPHRDRRRADIIKVGDLYDMCFQGVWFMGRSPNGPWEVTGSVPGQIDDIPVSSPSFNVTNVTVVENNSDAVVFATAPPTPDWGCAVWGTG